MQEHHIDGAGNSHSESSADLVRAGSFYHELSTGQQCPRALFFDLDDSSDKTEPFRALFPLDSYVYGKAGTGNNWAVGHRSMGVEMIDGAMERIRNLVEECDVLEGFMVTHALGGGTGSGFGSLLLDTLAETYRASVMTSVALLPSHSTSCVVEPYNEVLSVHHMLQSTTMILPFDNATLMSLNSAQSTGLYSFAPINRVIARAMANMTSSLRFPGTLNTSMRKMLTNLVPFPRLRFCSTSMAPFDQASRLSVKALVGQLFDSGSSLLGLDWKKGRFISSYLAFRGYVSSSEVDVECARMKDAHSFIHWVPDSFFVSLSKYGAAPAGGSTDGSSPSVSATLVANSTAISGGILRKQMDRYGRMLRRKAFLQHFLGEGMELAEFSEAESNLRDLIDEYQNVHDSEAVEMPLVEQHEDAPKYVLASDAETF